MQTRHHAPGQQTFTGCCSALCTTDIKDLKNKYLMEDRHKSLAKDKEMLAEETFPRVC